MHIQHGAISDSVSLLATTFYLTQSQISAPISGYLTKVMVQQGDKVHKGQALFKMQTIEAHVLQSDTLSKLGNMKIAASSKGTITNVNYSVGDFVQKGGILAKMASPDNLYLKLFVPFGDQSKINKNGKIKFRLPSGSLVTADYTKTLSQAAAKSQSVVWLFKPNQSKLLPAGLTFSVQVPTTLHKNTQILPKKAVLANTTLTSFWVMKVVQDSIAVKVPIKKGIQTSNKVEVLSPHFNPRDKIIISGQYGLEDSTIVQIQ
jgi:multidrug efflux pump subunit AcrA (membrane-fusion protein)